MKREKALLRNTIILALGTFLPRVINIATTPLTIRYLNTEQVGLVNLLTTTILTFLVPIATLQLEQAFFRFLIDAKTDESKAKIISSGMVVIFGIMVTIAMITFWVPISGFDGGYKWLIIGYIWIEILSQISRFILRAFSMYKQYSIFAMLAVIANLISLLVCLIGLRMGYHSIIISLVIADVVGLGYALLTSPILRYIRFDAFSMSTAKEMIYFSLPFIPNMVAWSANLSADQFLITGFLGKSPNGIYTTAYKVPSIVSMLYPAFNLAWTESASRAISEEGTATYYSRMYRMIYCILTGGTALLIAISPYIFAILVPKKSFMSALQYVPILILATYIYCFAQFFSSIYIAIKQGKHMSISTILAASFNLALNLVLLKTFGLWAAVFASLLSNILLAGYRYYDINHHYYKMRVSYRLTILTVSIFGIELLLFFQNNTYLNIANIILALVFAYFLCDDIIIGLWKTHKSK